MPRFGEYAEVDEETGDNLGADSSVDQYNEGGEDSQEAQTTEVEPQVDPTEDLRAELATVRRELTEAQQTLRLAYPALQQQQAQREQQESRPPIEWNKITNSEELKQYLDWQMAQREKQLVAQMQQTATQANSEAVVRGVLTREAVGPGWSYDDLVSQYAGPAMRQDPKLAEFFYGQGDPAMNMYMYSLFHGLLKNFGGDTVKMVKAVVGSVTKPGKVAQNVVKQITEATNRGAMKVLRGSNGAQTVKKQPDNYFKLPEKEFQQLLAANS